jgi:hypothetical protein
MTDYQAIPIPPPSLGEILAGPEVWHTRALTMPVPAAATMPARRVRRPRRAVRKLAALAALVGATALLSIGCSSGATASDRVSRPLWDGRRPAEWTAEADPLCWPAIAGRHGWIRAGSNGPRWRAECQRDGRTYVWGIVSGSRR